MCYAIRSVNPSIPERLRQKKQAEATEALEYYDEILKSILEGKMVGKRASSSDDQLFFSMPDNAQPEQYQTFVFDGNTYKSIGPFDTEEELFNALKDYTDAEVEAGTEKQARYRKKSLHLPHIFSMSSVLLCLHA